MGFTVRLKIIYSVLIGLAIFSFVRKKKAVGIVLSDVIVISILILGYLWIISPM